MGFRDVLLLAAIVIVAVWLFRTRAKWGPVAASIVRWLMGVKAPVPAVKVKVKAKAKKKSPAKKKGAKR